VTHTAALFYVFLWSAVVACSQAAAPVALSGPLRDHVRDERFQMVTSIRGLPLGVRAELEKLFGGHALDIAEPGAPFRTNDTGGDPMVPARRLVAAGCSYEHCLVYYERGGTAPTWRVALFHWTPEATRFELGGAAPGGLKTIAEVQTATLSGALTSAAGLW
jgi:hypothetical protein